MAATEVVSGVSGESEENIREVFEAAVVSFSRLAQLNYLVSFCCQLAAPCVLFLDEIDAITQKREQASKDMERRIVSQLLTCMDGERPPCPCADLCCRAQRPS